MAKKLFSVFFLIALLFGFVAVAPSYADNNNKGKSVTALRAEARAESKALRERTKEYRDALRQYRGEVEEDEEEGDDDDKDDNRWFGKHEWQNWFGTTTATTSPKFGWSHDGDCKLGDDVKKVQVCHMTANGAGQTIEISKNALKAHLAHGDYVGGCATGGNPPVDLTGPIISGVSASISNATATISWLTSDASDSRLWYSTSTPVVVGSSSTFFLSSAVLAHNHGFVLPNLLSSTTYYFLVSSADAAGNRSTSTQSSFTVGDIVAPIISNVSVVHSTSSPATTTAISWTTSEGADSKLWLSTTTPLNPFAVMTMSTSSSAFVTFHQFIFPGLLQGVPYYYVISSADIFGNRSTTTEATFVAP